MTEFDGAQAARTAARGRLLRAIAGTPGLAPESEPDAPTQPAIFDSGARRTVPLPAPTHEQTLSALLQTRSADVTQFSD
jgi:hypothetical protein